MTVPFGRIEKAVRELIVTLMPAAEGLVDGDLSFNPSTDPFHIAIALIPGGTTNELEGEWVLDIDVFDRYYTRAMDRALELEAALLRRGGHRTSVMRIDRVYQNLGPAARPWDDDAAHRIGGTYVFVARRSG